MADTYVKVGDRSRAAELYQSALAIQRAIGDRGVITLDGAATRVDERHEEDGRGRTDPGKHAH